MPRLLSPTPWVPASSLLSLNELDDKYLPPIKQLLSVGRYAKCFTLSHLILRTTLSLLLSPTNKELKAWWKDSICPTVTVLKIDLGSLVCPSWSLAASQSHFKEFKKLNDGTFLAVQWLRLHTSTARYMGLIPGRELRVHIPCNAAKTKIRQNLKKNGSDGSSGKELACQCRRHKWYGFDPWVKKIPWRRAWESTFVFLPGDSHRQRCLMGYSS